MGPDGVLPSGHKVVLGQRQSNGFWMYSLSNAATMLVFSQLRLLDLGVELALEIAEAAKPEVVKCFQTRHKENRHQAVVVYLPKQYETDPNSPNFGAYKMSGHGVRVCQSIEDVIKLGRSPMVLINCQDFADEHVKKFLRMQEAHNEAAKDQKNA